MKKLMSMILALVMALSLVACGDKGDKGGRAYRHHHRGGGRGDPGP